MAMTAHRCARVALLLSAALTLAVSFQATGASAIAELEATVRNDPELSRADVLVVLTHFRDRDFDQALVAARKLADRHPDNASAHNLLGAAYEANKDDLMARRSYRKAVALEPDYATAALNLARLDLHDGKREEARAAYRAILETHADQPVALVALAKMASEDGRTGQAIALLERARDRNTSAIQPRVILANYHLRRGNGKQALALAREAYEIAPRRPTSALLLGRAQIANGMVDDAIGTLRQLADRFPDSAETHINLALAYGHKRDAGRTRRALDRVLEIEPGNPLAILGLGTLALRTGQLDEATKIARALQQAHPRSPAGFNLEGDVMMARGKPHDAASAYHTALEKSPASATALKLYAARSRADEPNASATLSDWLNAHPDDTAVRLAYASTLHQQGDKAGATAEYERVLETQPDNALALNNLAWLYYEKGDTRAIALAEHAYSRAPERVEIMDTYGWLLIEDGRVEQGLHLLESAARRAPQNGDVRYHLAAGLAQAGDTSRARRELSALLDSGTEFSEKPAAMALLEALN